MVEQTLWNISWSNEFSYAVFIASIVNQLKECGRVTETASPPVSLVKKNGEPRLIVDDRKQNWQTTPMNFPMPGLDEQFHNVAS